MSEKRNYVEEFNELPYAARHIATMVSARENINYLQREKARLKKRYRQSLAEINAHIKGIEVWIAENEKWNGGEA